MTILLKVILGLLIALAYIVAKGLYSDFKQTIKTPQYEESTIFEKLQLKFTFFFIMAAITSLCLFLLYFIINPLTINAYF